MKNNLYTFNIFKFFNVPPEDEIKYAKIMLVLIIMYIFIFHLEKIIGKKATDKIHEWTEECVSECKDEQCDKVNGLRGSGYYLLGDDGTPTNCLITKWEISHFIFHAFLGYYTNIYFSQSLSIGFEIYEQAFFKCGSILDLVYNFLGFLFGYYLRTLK